jgi:hypothetical protein
MACLTTPNNMQLFTDADAYRRVERVGGFEPHAIYATA